LDDFVAQAVTQNCAGIECLSGIPGSVGGTPAQNVGAYGQQVSDTIESVRALDLRPPDLKEDRIVVLPNPACGFRYRASIFNGAERGRYIIVRVNYRLKRGGAPSLRYADLEKHFAGRKTPPALAEVRDAVRAIRRSKGMLIVPEIPIATALDRSLRIPGSARSSSQIWARAPPREDSRFPATPRRAHKTMPNVKFRRPGWSSTQDIPKDTQPERPGFRRNTPSR